MKFHFGASIAILLACAAATPVQAETVLHPEGVYVQEPTGMSYPPALGDFTRVNVIRYVPDGSDESTGYNRMMPMQEIAATVYVFPSPSLHSFGSPQSVIDDARANLCAQQFAAIEQSIGRAHPDAVLVNDGETTLTQGGVPVQGHRASYMLTNPSFFGRSDVASGSEAYLFCFVGGKWSVEYRFDYPKDYDAGKDIAGFMQGLVWTIPPEN